MFVSLPPADTANGSYFIKYAANKTSQGGEDGVLAKIFELMKLNDNVSRMCVDVGAWDGIHLSNSHSLLWNSEHPWGGILIEADIERVRDMKNLYATRSDVICVGEHVDVSNKTNNFRSDNLLKSILRAHNVPLDFDFLSIDVDGADYHLWHQLCTSDGRPEPDEDSYLPKVVCIEFNPSIPNCIHFVQECDTRVHQGNSLLALFELGHRLGYELVATTTFNAIFVRRDQYLQYILPELERAGPAASPSLAVGGAGVKSLLDIMHPPASMYTYMFQTYDGELKYAGSKKLIWHKLALNPQKLQMLPVRDRKFPYEPQYEVLLSEVQATAKAFLGTWALLVTCGEATLAALKLIEEVVTAAAKLLPIACVCGRVMDILTSLVHTVNAESLSAQFESASSDSQPKQYEVARRLVLLMARHEVWLRTVFLVGSLFIERGHIYFHLTAGGDRVARGKDQAEDVASALRWYRAAMGVLQPVSELLCQQQQGLDQGSTLSLSPQATADADQHKPVVDALTDYLRMAERNVGVLNCSLFAEVALLLSQCCRTDGQVLESFGHLSMHRRALGAAPAGPDSGEVYSAWLIHKVSYLLGVDGAELVALVLLVEVGRTTIADAAVEAHRQEKQHDLYDEFQKLNKIVKKGKYTNNLL